jgi:hypothetical protein
VAKDSFGRGDAVAPFGKPSSKFFGRNWSNGENVVPARGGDFDDAFHMLLTFNLA